MAKPKFYLEPRPSENGNQSINMFYSFNGKRLQYYTGVRVNIKHFRDDCNKNDRIKPIDGKAKHSAKYNTLLEDMASDAVSIVTKARGEDLTVKYVREQLDAIYKPKNEPEPTPEFKHTFLTFFNKIIQDSKEGKRLISTGKNKGQRFTHNAIKNYGTTFSAIKRYLKARKLKDIGLEAINKDFYDDFLDFCYNTEKKEISTFAGYIKDIKTVMKESKVNTFDTKEFTMPNYEADTVALTLDQIDKIHNLDLNDKPRHDNIRDLFLVGCYSALRFSDYNNLQIESIENGFIRIKQTKTGARVTIPIMSRMQKILDKHNGGLPNSVSNQEFNRIIKEVVKMAGLTHRVSVRSMAGNKESFTDIAFDKLISSHTARRSYATIMFKKGVAPMLIMSATGHKTESSFLRYIKANNEDKAQLMAETLKKLGL